MCAWVFVVVLWQSDFGAEPGEGHDASTGLGIAEVPLSQVNLVESRNSGSLTEIAARLRHTALPCLAFHGKLRHTITHHHEVDLPLIRVANET